MAWLLAWRHRVECLYPGPGQGTNACRTKGNAERLAAFFDQPGPTVLYVGKLIFNKGVQLLLEALDGLDAKAVIVGFGDYRDELEALAPERALFTGALEHRHLKHLLPLCQAAVVPSIFPEALLPVIVLALVGREGGEL